MMMKMMMNFAMRKASLIKRTKKDQKVEILDLFGLIRKKTQKSTTVS